MIVHSYPLGEVLVQSHVTRNKSIIVGLQPIDPPGPFVPLHADEYDAPELAPVEAGDIGYQDAEKGLGRIFRKPMYVIAAEKITVAGNLDLEQHGLALIADEVRFESDTSVTINEGAPFATWKPAPEVRSGQLYIVARHLTSPAAATQVKLRAYGAGCEISCPDWAARTPHVVVMTQAPTDAVRFVQNWNDNGWWSSKSFYCGGKNFCAKPSAEITKFQITNTSFNRLLDHYAPMYQRRSYERAEQLYRSRQEDAAELAYALLNEDAAGTGTIFETSGEVRETQLERGLNYIGEDDRLLRRFDVQLQLESLVNISNQLDNVRSSYVAMAASDSELTVSVATIDNTVANVEDRLDVAKLKVDAAKIRLEYAQTQVSSDGTLLESLLDTYSGEASAALGQYNAFITKANSGDCVEKPSFWDIIAGIFKAVVDLVSLNWGDVLTSVAGGIEQLVDLATTTADLIDLGKGAYKNFKAVYKGLKPAIDSATAAYEVADQYFSDIEQLETTLTSANWQYDKLGTAKSHNDAHWNIGSVGSGCDYPQIPLASPFEMKALTTQIEAARGSVALAGIEVREAKTLLDAAILEVANLGGELERTKELENVVIDQNGKMNALMNSALPYHAGLVDARERICFRGQRMMDRMVRKAYDVERALAYLNLDFVSSNGPESVFATGLNNTPANISGVPGGELSHFDFKFNYDWTKDGSALMADLIGIGASYTNLADAWAATAGSIQDSQALELVLGQEGTGVSVSDLEEFKATGVLNVHLGYTSAFIQNKPVRRVHRVQLVLTGQPNGLEFTAQKLDRSVFRKGSDVLVLPYANILDGAGDDMDSKGATAVVSVSSEGLLDSDGEVLQDVTHPHFGLSLEGDWRLRLDPGFSLDDLQDVTGAKVIIRFFE